MLCCYIQDGVIDLETGWSKIKSKGIDRLYKIVEGQTDDKFTNADTWELYETVYRMCVQKAPHCFTWQLYDRFVECVDDYLTRIVAPAVLSKRGVDMVEELIYRWQQHKVFGRWMCLFFDYIDRYHTKRYNVPGLASVCVGKFETVVFDAAEAPYV